MKSTTINNNNVFFAILNAIITRWRSCEICVVEISGSRVTFLKHARRSYAHILFTPEPTHLWDHRSADLEDLEDKLKSKETTSNQLISHVSKLSFSTCVPEKLQHLRQLHIWNAYNLKYNIQNFEFIKHLFRKRYNVTASL